MTPRCLTVSVPGNASVVLTLPQPLTADLVDAFEKAFADQLGALRCELRGSGDAGEIEYRSWMPILQPARS